MQPIVLNPNSCGMYIQQTHAYALNHGQNTAVQNTIGHHDQNTAAQNTIGHMNVDAICVYYEVLKHAKK
eukprot:12414232-Karenia_brevis.AAC.1